MATVQYHQAIRDFDEVIETEPTHTQPYLDRSIAYFELEEYEKSLEDFETYTSQISQKSGPIPHSAMEFTSGFARGLPKGIYESGEGILLFLADLVMHPVHTSKQMLNALTTLNDLARTDEWSLIAESLGPRTISISE